MNAIKRQLNQFKINKQAIEGLLKWTPLEYAEFQWEMMEDYICAFCEGDQEGIMMYSRSEVYRKWWVNQWNLRDIANIEDMDTLYWMNDRREYYKYVHSAEYLLTHTILAHGEDMIIGRVIDEKYSKKKQKA